MIEQIPFGVGFDGFTVKFKHVFDLVIETRGKVSLVTRFFSRVVGWFNQYLDTKKPKNLSWAFLNIQRLD